MPNRKESGVSRREFVTTTAIGATATALVPSVANAQEADIEWHHTADFVSIGAGVAGLAAAVSALEHGASVILVDENMDIGGHGMVSGGIVNLGGGHRIQQAHGVEDSADKVYEDWTRPDHPHARYNDRDLVRTFADMNASTFNWLMDLGVEFHEDEILPPEVAMTVPRQVRTQQWPNKDEIYSSVVTRRGSGLVRRLEQVVREGGAEIMLEHRMTGIVREQTTSGRVLGITVEHGGREINIRGTKGVLIATGGHSNNIEFRRIFDPRLTEEYRVTGDPYSRKSADGEIAAMELGASLWGTALQTTESVRYQLFKPASIGGEFISPALLWPADSPIFDKIRATGIQEPDWSELILVTQDGERFYDETANDYDFIAAAMESRGEPDKLNGGGPIWAIFDHDAVERQGWDPRPPYVDPDGFFFSADTIAELAARIENPHQPYPMPAGQLEATVERYNRFADNGVDEDFGKPQPLPRIETPPFYAAWATPIVHDSYAGLRTNANTQVIDLHGDTIDGLYCAGESQGGFSLHGLGRCVVFGRIAGRHAAQS